MSQINIFSIKAFLKPTRWKVLLGLIFFVASSFFSTHILEVGFPLSFIVVDFELGPDIDEAHYNLLFLVIDILFWYLISCSTLFIMNKVFPNKKTRA